MTSGTPGIPGMYADYLRRLGVADPGAPSTEGLFALQRAHLERVPYENLAIQLGRPPGIDPALSVRRFAAGQGGYCLHLNGGLAALLEALGYDVTRHVGGVCKDPDSRENKGDHLVLTVRVDGAEYVVDVGIGDGPHEPLPLREGTYERAGFQYSLERLEPLEGEAESWTYRQRGSTVPRMNFRAAPAGMAEFEQVHAWLSTAEESPFVRTLAMLRRDAEGIDMLQGLVLGRIDPVTGQSKRELTTPEELFEVVTTVFGRTTDDLTDADRRTLWTRAERAHEAWLAERSE